MTEAALQKAFERNSLKRIVPEPSGEKFDPNRHQAVMEQPAEDVGPGSVIMVMQPGYELFGRVIRPAMVAVSPKAAAPQPTASPAAGPPADSYLQDAAGAAAGATFDTKA